MTEMVQVPAYDGNGAIPTYVARPAGTPRAAIIVIPEIFGVNAGIREKCDDWAAKGYLSVAPDIFWRFAPGVELDPDVPEQLEQAFANMNTYVAAQSEGHSQSVDDAQAIANWLRHEQGIAKVGLVGFCLGGRIAYLVATRTNMDATVGYYGVMIDQALGESHAIAKPLMLHIPTADHFVSPEAQRAMHEALDPNPHCTLHDYPGLDHGFATTHGNRRDEAGAQLADGRTADFFAANLA
ncbi:MAG: dienelactone hydrolase family protein [Sphingomonadales bacterium]|nr:dienelactone hydrolase family protein [Sphingomonadales bacterium]MBD3773619.1 dienelactone hydrolase family protein [Paracoccaceae bacterium]